MSIDIRKANEALKKFYKPGPSRMTKLESGSVILRCDGGCHTSLCFDPRKGVPDYWYIVKFRDVENKNEGFLSYCRECYPIAKNLYDLLFGGNE